MNRLSRNLGFVLGASLAFAARPAAAEDLSADQIAAKIIRGNGFTWEGAHTRLQMTLTDEKGQKSERSLDVLGRRKDGRLASKVVFLSPTDVAGTKFLTVEKASGGTEQYIYLPGLKRTRRISGRDQEGSFMGSDFTYSDLARKDDAGAKHTKLPDESVGSDATYVVESTPASIKEAGYSKVRAWVRKTDFVALRTRFYDASGKLVKTLYAKKVRDMDGKPVVVEATMKSENGHSTDLVVDSLDKRAEIPDAEFSPTSLER
jgi:hypothetical protein